MSQTLHGRLVDAAGAQTMAHYAQLGEHLGLDMSNTDDRIRIGAMLDEIDFLEHNAGRPLLSAVVVHAQDGLPGTGFFDCARKLGLLKAGKRQEELEFFVSELRRVQAYWGSTNSGRAAAL